MKIINGIIDRVRSLKVTEDLFSWSVATLSLYSITLRTEYGQLSHLTHSTAGVATKEVGTSIYNYLPERLKTKKVKLFCEGLSVIGINTGFQLAKAYGLTIPGTNPEFAWIKLLEGLLAGSIAMYYDNKKK